VALGVRAKLFLVSIALIAASMGLADAYLTRSVADHVVASMRAELVVRARLVAREAGEQRAPLDLADPSWDRLAHALGRSAEGRVTIVRRDGVVLGDSEVVAADLARLENHASRPEIQAALATGAGTAERMSATVQEPMLYAAVPFERDGAVAGVARVSEALREVDAAKADMRRLIWTGSGLALVLALLLSNLVAKRLAADVLRLNDAALRMADGDLTVRTHVEGHDELAELGRGLDRLAKTLASTLGQLRAERDLQAGILDAMEEGVVVVDRQDRILRVNPAIRSMLLFGEDAAGKLLIEAVRHAQLHDLLQRVRREARPGRLEIDVPGLKPRRLLARASPMQGDDGRLLFVFVDVTELRRLESLRREFVANASHELRTPIAAVRSAAETLRDGALDEPAAAARFVDIIDRNAQRLQALVEDMLELSRIESNQFRLRSEPVDLSTTVPLVLALFRERAEKKGVRLEARFDPAASTLVGDSRALEHVLSNLVDNAVKYCARGSEVLVTTSAKGDRVELAVRDDGPGIPPEHLPRVFERFYRVDAGRSRDVGGTGLGLSIVRHMVEAMRGDVRVESEVGRGSTFVVTLPRA
jgi:two-component system phosphate regulon sensor histidine kinase PhoR